MFIFINVNFKTDISLGAQESIIRNDEDNYYNKIKAYLDTKKSAENTKANELAERKGLDTEGKNKLILSKYNKKQNNIQRNNYLQHIFRTRFIHDRKGNSLH